MVDSNALKHHVNMGCMEVWGGNRPTRQSFARPGLDVSVWSQTADRPTSGGGDLHYMSSCASGRITRMLLADICACGTVFSELARELRTLMIKNVNAIKQARFVREMNRRLRDYSDRGGFATVLISTYFAPTRSFTLCNAGHPPPFRYSARNGHWTQMKHVGGCNGDGLSSPLGVVDQQEYQQFHTRLEVGDMVLTYSNALTECRDAHGQLLGVDGVLRYLNGVDISDTTRVPEMLADAIEVEHGENLAVSDVTIVLCKATTAGVGWKNNLLAPFRLLGSVSNRTRFQDDQIVAAPE